MDFGNRNRKYSHSPSQTRLAARRALAEAEQMQHRQQPYQQQQQPYQYPQQEYQLGEIPYEQQQQHQQPHQEPQQSQQEQPHTVRDQRNPSKASQLRALQVLRDRNFSSHVFDAYDAKLGPPDAPRVRESVVIRNDSHVFDAIDPIKNPLNKGNVARDWQVLQTAPYDNTVYNPPRKVDKNASRPEVQKYSKRTTESHCFDEYVPRTTGKKINYDDTPFQKDNGIFEQYDENRHHVDYKPHRKMNPNNKVHGVRRNPTIVEELPAEKPIRAKRIDNYRSSTDVMHWEVQPTVHSRPVAGIREYEAENGPAWRQQLKEEEDAARIRQLPIVKPAYKSFAPAQRGEFSTGVQASVNRARFLNHMKEYYDDQNFTALDVKRKNEADSLFRPPSPEPVAFQTNGQDNPQFRPMSQFKSLDGYKENAYITPQMRRKQEDRAVAEAMQNNRVQPVQFIRNKMKSSVFSQY